eukprot:TRINITY_DN7408_c0_g1_i1.p1 TRINITY_DN7408_c0_g1~~TRINITY_DN7408_c0_g1_i1.p1  ORF type:complete len:184 (-),score=31.88 TRINITY_DN7408_c0_g1_i1:15-485(-)
MHMWTWTVLVVSLAVAVTMTVVEAGECPVSDGRRWGCVPCFGDLSNCTASCNYCTSPSSDLSACLSNPAPLSSGWLCIDLDKCVIEGNFNCYYQSGLSTGDLVVIGVGCLCTVIIIGLGVSLLVRSYLLRRRYHQYNKEFGDHDHFQSDVYHSPEH